VTKPRTGARQNALPRTETGRPLAIRPPPVTAAVLARLKGWARALKAQIFTVYLVARDPATPWAARVVAGLTLAYALSPIDLIPDFIPVLGLLDDLLVVPLGLWLALRLTPAAVRERCAAQARERFAAGQRLPRQRAAAVAIVLVWLAAALALGWWLWPAAAL
jgi:uncharacterized membrane protein YkvA (DUF1232 family)